MVPDADFAAKLGRYALALGAGALTTGLSLPLHGVVDPANIALLFVLAVVLVAARLGRGPAVAASFFAVACFDFFFVPPRFSFTVAHAQYLITFLVMLAVSLIVTHLTNAYRDKASEADTRAREASMLHRLASALAGAMTVAQVAEQLKSIGQEGRYHLVALCVPAESERLQVAASGDPGLGGGEDEIAARVYRDGRVVRLDAADGSSDAVVWLPLQGATRRRGVLAIRARAASSDAEMALLTSIAALATTALERIHFVAVAQATTLEIQAERLRNSMLSALSHDLRTPLTVLYGLADALAAGEGLTAEQQAMAATLRDQSHRLHRMADNLLDMARFSTGRFTPSCDWQSIPELVGASVRAMSPWLDPARLRFHWADDLPLVQVDAVLMERVFCNLLENAIKYSPAGAHIDVGGHVEASDNGGDGGGAARLHVWFDNPGEGFPRDRQARVFDAFERGRSESSIPGVGLGLSVCRTIVDAHGGAIRASNRTGGARVTLQLPLAATPAIPAEPGEGETT